MHEPVCVASINPVYQHRLLRAHGIDHQEVGELFTVPGFQQHNWLVEINRAFAQRPAFGLVYRNGGIKHPVKQYAPLGICAPTRQFDLAEAAEITVKRIAASGSKINLMWSGGIDSTFVVTAFLQHCDHAQLRILYSPWSCYEHPNYIRFLQQFDQIELIDISGDVYMRTQAWDGCYVTGDGGDESHASVDESFFNTHGYQCLHSPWIDFLSKHCDNSDFIDFCQWFFAQSGRPIDTVLEARWWFYISCKYYGQLFYGKWPFFLGGFDQFEPGRLISFFDNAEYQSFAYHSVPKIFYTDQYTSWKQFLKDYCYSFDNLQQWWRSHKKLNSTQLYDYCYKKLTLLDRRWLIFLNNGTRIATAGMPWFSEKQYLDSVGAQVAGVFDV